MPPEPTSRRRRHSIRRPSSALARSRSRRRRSLHVREHAADDPHQRATAARVSGVLGEVLPPDAADGTLVDAAGDADLEIDSVPGYNYDIVAGVDYTIDVTKPVGERIVGLEVPWNAGAGRQDVHARDQQLPPGRRRRILDDRGCARLSGTAGGDPPAPDRLDRGARYDPPRGRFRAVMADRPGVGGRRISWGPTARGWQLWPSAKPDESRATPARGVSRERELRRRGATRAATLPPPLPAEATRCGWP